ncbi:MAG: hypothetical protein RSG52_01840 [Terrisporobacter sp.]|uniref:hypothetical protein n=1 Tax=Terrisporobacter sp. TaxID=1965305 RepID=UPI002FC73159
MRFLDILVFTMDIMLFGYFTQIALNTTSMTTRILSCAAMTLEIFFMIQHMKMMKITKEKN